MAYLFTDEGARQSNNGPEENATAQDDLSVEAVAQVTKDGSCYHEAADEDCGRRKENVTEDVVTGNVSDVDIFLSVFVFHCTAIYSNMCNFIVLCCKNP